ncbi:hypothetical protein ACHAWF_004263 [Thalassiosira exigua]
MQFVKDLINPRKDGSGGDKSDREQPLILLVIQSDNTNYDWVQIFSGRQTRDGRQIEVVQAGWDELHVTADSPAMSPHNCPPRCGNSKLAIVHILQQSKDGNRESRTIRPDFVLVRNEVRGGKHTQDYRNALFGLMYANIPSVNSLKSIYSFLERPIVQGELHKIQSSLGSEGIDLFPVIPQSYFASDTTMMYGSKFPVVLKVGHAHAGLGKMKVANHHDWEDVRSVVAIADGKYCTAEPFINGEYDIRIQKIGGNYRAYKRRSLSGTWKTNTGYSIIDVVELIPDYKRWIDEACKMFGGLDICTVDAIHDSGTNKDYIMEVNGTSSGLLPEYAGEDNMHICDLVVDKMNKCVCE